MNLDLDMDKAICTAFPLLIAPKSSRMARHPLVNGTRFIGTANGLLREIALPWVVVRHLVARSAIELPYGTVESEVVFKCSTVPRVLWKAFRNDAVAAMPNEMAAAMIWNEHTDLWRYETRRVNSASPVHVRYEGEGIELAYGEHIVVDLHSHGRFPAFFSQEDNADDMHSMRLSGVLGNVETTNPSFVLRLNMPKFQWAARVGANGEFEVSI